MLNTINQYWRWLEWKTTFGNHRAFFGVLVLISFVPFWLITLVWSPNFGWFQSKRLKNTIAAELDEKGK